MTLPMTDMATRFDCGRMAERAVRRGMIIQLLAPGVLVLLVFVVRKRGIGIDESQAPVWLPTLFYVLLGLAVADLLAAFTLRRILLAPLRLRNVLGDTAAVERIVMSATTVTFALGASPVVYGVVLYLLGGTMQQVAVLAIISLLSFRFLRPDVKFLEEVLGEAARG
ncbi:MAG: hypothetical protein AB1792_11440 [Candidatus Zixiibacteriota bacterium]